MVMLRVNVRGGNASEKTAIVFFLAVVTIVALGCGGAKVGDKPQSDADLNVGSESVASRTGEAEARPASNLDAAAQGETLDEFWRVSRLNGSKTGYSRMTVQQAQHADESGEMQPAYFVTVHEETRIQRFGELTNQAYTIRSLMREDGGLIAFEARLQAGGSDAVTRGTLEGGRLRIVNEVGGERQIASTPWNPEWGGVGALDLLLKKQPMKPGEKRSMELLTPVVHQKMQIDLEALDWRDDVRIPDGRRLRLLELKWKVQTAGLNIDGSQWMDENGEVQMSRLPSLNEVTYRTDRKTALVAEAEIADLGVATIVKLPKPLDSPRQTKRVVFSARLKHSDPASSFVSGLSQRVRSIDGRHAEIEVHAIRPNLPADAKPIGGEDREPTAGDREPNALIQSDDPAVKKLADEVSGEDPWEVASKLERLVHERIDSKNFSQAFASAADVAKRLEGDCTEHAVLLAAVCRAKKIPSRVAVGLVYFPREEGFAYHMWNEVWIKGRWVPLDATLGEGGVGAERLKVASSDLQGASPYAAFLPVLPLLQQLELEVVSAE